MAPRPEGLLVIAVVATTGAPLMYIVVVLPESVTATCVQAPVVNWTSAGASRFCPARPKRTRPPAVRGTKYMLLVVAPLLKSNTRAQVEMVSSFTQKETVQSSRVLTMPAGRTTWPPSWRRRAEPRRASAPVTQVVAPLSVPSP